MAPRKPVVAITHSPLERSLLGEVMESGEFEPEWLLLDWLYAGSVHWIAGPPGEGKTWLALWFCSRIIKQAGNVLYLDEENSLRIMAERLHVLGCTPEQVDEHFYYARNPGLDAKRIARLEATLALHEPVLSIFDASADFLSIYDADENAARDVTRWITNVVRKPIEMYDGTAVVLDHTPHGHLRARGSGAKKAKPEVSYVAETSEPFSRYGIGELKVTQDKDREGWLVYERRLRIGTEQTGAFVMEEKPGLTVKLKKVSAGGRVAEGDANRENVFEALTDELRSTKELAAETGLHVNRVRDHLKALLEDGRAATGTTGRERFCWRRS